MKISDIAEVINETVKEPSKSGIDVFVGLEHYDIAEPVIKRFGSTQMLSTAAKVFKKGDVLIARRNVYLQRAAMAPFSGLTSGDSIVLRVKDNFDTKETDYETMSKLLPFILNSIDFWDYANTNADGTMSKRLSPALLLDYEFDLPSIEEQKLRAEKLWAAYEVKQSYLKMIKATQEMVQSQFIEMFGDCETNAKNYPIKKVGDFADCFAGATPSTKISAYWDKGEIPWMSSGEVHKGRVKDTDVKITQQGYDGCSTKMVPIHSVVVALAGQGKTRGTVAINDIELCTNQSLCAMVPNVEVNYEYLYHNLKGRYKELRSMSGDVDGRGGLNLKHIQSIRVVVPPMEEQLKFVSIAQQADKSEFELKKSIEAIDAVIKSLINS